MNLPFRGIHHDGSSLYVRNQAPRLGDVVPVRLRFAADVAVDQVGLRTVHDGEPRFFEASLIKESSTERWYEALLPIVNPRTNYRWLLVGGDCRYLWRNAQGLFDYEVSDAHDFAIAAYPELPVWARSAVVYQVFPDRFAKSSRTYDVPSWAVPREWGRYPEGRSANTGVEYFGGDLWGVAEKLDYLTDLGVCVVYMTPIFPAHTTHRYDATTFDHVDPLLGGDDALRHLIDEAHKRGMRVVGDITLNHCGKGHEWFQRAQAGDPEFREFFTFDDSLEHGYECWWGVASLPKFDYRSEALRERLITGTDSVLRRWLRFGLDGWRVDVANMSGRLGALDLTHEVARLARAAVEAEGAEKILIAEHFHDAGADLKGDGWHGTMNYSAFTRPVWAWLHDDAFAGQWLGAPVPIPEQDGHRVVNTINSFASGMPWRSYLHSWPLLGSHDTARIRSVVGSADRQVVAAGLLMTLPGTPMIFAGDEIGAQGLWGEDSRTTFPWANPEQWDTSILRVYRDLILLRKELPALADGGLRWLHIGADLLVFARESESETVIVAASRGDSRDIRIPVAAHGVERLFGSMTLQAGADVVLGDISTGVSIWRTR